MKIQKNLFLAEKAESTLNRLSVFTSRLQGTSLGWHKIQEEYMLDAFKAAAKYVPAYRNFLKEHGVLARCIKTIKDFAQVPPVSKKNYLKKYPWNDICMRGAISSQQLILTATSGSTGEPYYFPRTATIDEQSYLFHRIFLKGSGLDETEPTLVIVAFGMGVWIGGIITYEAFKRISERDFPLTILTPGVNKKEIYDALTEIGGNYTQLVLCGYPPFIKDIIDDGPENGINWNSFDMRIV